MASEQAEIDRQVLAEFESILRPKSEALWNAYVHSLLRRTTSLSMSLFPENRFDLAVRVEKLLESGLLNDEQEEIIRGALAECIASWNVLAASRPEP